MCVGFAMDLQWICVGFAMDLRWICNGFAIDLRWICNGFALVQGLGFRIQDWDCDLSFFLRPRVMSRQDAGCRVEVQVQAWDESKMSGSRIQGL